ncbi:methionine ABC transporter ATP-binding protein [Oceanivirga salmonicida]|uniref:methionine ABC transporter ATP-binding protein n=1 Tax=Oceanivirga salmonicida TaxID=1769291 RepID=UPI0008300411|nr:methionine ABC transporter ATP-binding protein [Oceanivirga salmonicida]
MIKIDKVNKTFEDKKVLKNITMHISKGEIFGVIGLSGAGKSTLIRLLNKLEDIDDGEIIINSKSLNNITKNELYDLRKKTSMIFQHFNLLSSRTVYGNISLALELDKKLTNKEKEEKIEKVLKLVELYDKKDSYISKLSGGQKQRVAIARALVTEPEIILSDESTSALDPITANNILDLLKKINKELNITIVIITHQMEVIKKMCDRIAVLKDGEIIEEGETKEIFLKPKEEFTRNLIGTIKDEMPNSKTWILHFLGTHANKSYISQASKIFGIDINILGGSIHTLSKGEKVGYLIVQFETDSSDEIVKWFNEHKIDVEVLHD